MELARLDDTSFLRTLDAAVADVAPRMALYLVYEHPTQVIDRPELARTFFAERCISESDLNEWIEAFRSVGAYVEVFKGEIPFLDALGSGRLERTGRPLQLIYNGVGFGITDGGYEPGRMALLPALADSLGMLCTNADAYTCAFALHRYHSFLVLRALGVATPPVWHFREGRGWMGDRPPSGVKVITKSTYEAWSVGVTEDSVFEVDGDTEHRVSRISRSIGQPVTLQQFVSGREVCVPILAAPQARPLPVVEQILSRAPNDPDAVMTIWDNLGQQSDYEYQPFEASANLQHQLTETALSAFEILQCRALGRMDFRIDAATDRAWLTDAAVTPGLSRFGSVFASASTLGIEHATLLRAVVGASLASLGRLD